MSGLISFSIMMVAGIAGYHHDTIFRYLRTRRQIEPLQDKPFVTGVCSHCSAIVGAWGDDAEALAQAETEHFLEKYCRGEIILDRNPVQQALAKLYRSVGAIGMASEIEGHKHDFNNASRRCSCGVWQEIYDDPAGPARPRNIKKELGPHYQAEASKKQLHGQNTQPYKKGDLQIV